MANTLPNINFEIKPMVTLPKEEYDRLMKRDALVNEIIKQLITSQQDLNRSLKRLGV